MKKKTKLKDHEVAAWQVQAVRSFLLLSEVSTPREFQVFVSAFLSNLSANLPDKYWKAMRIVSPCNTAGCNCHVMAEKLMNTMEALRLDHRHTVMKQRASQ